MKCVRCGEPDTDKVVRIYIFIEIDGHLVPANKEEKAYYTHAPIHTECFESLDYKVYGTCEQKVKILSIKDMYAFKKEFPDVNPHLDENCETLVVRDWIARYFMDGQKVVFVEESKLEDIVKGNHATPWFKELDGGEF